MISITACMPSIHSGTQLNASYFLHSLLAAFHRCLYYDFAHVWLFRRMMHMSIIWQCSFILQIVIGIYICNGEMKIYERIWNDKFSNLYHFMMHTVWGLMNFLLDHGAKSVPSIYLHATLLNQKAAWKPKLSFIWTHCGPTYNSSVHHVLNSSLGFTGMKETSSSHVILPALLNAGWQIWVMGSFVPDPVCWPAFYWLPSSVYKNCTQNCCTVIANTDQLGPLWRQLRSEKGSCTRYCHLREITLEFGAFSNSYKLYTFVLMTFTSLCIRAVRCWIVTR